VEKHLNKRIIGAVVTVLAVAVVVPIVIDGSRQNLRLDDDMAPMPEMPDWAEVENHQRIRMDLESLASGEAAEELQAPVVSTADADDPVPAAATKQPERAVQDEEFLPFAWAIQMNAFSDRKNAESYRDTLRKKGYKAFTRSDGDGLTRVFVGPELQREAIENLRLRLQKELKRNDLRIKQYKAR